MWQTVIDVAAILAGVAAILDALEKLGCNVRIFGRRKTGSVTPGIYNRKSAWSAIALAALALVLAGISVYYSASPRIVEKIVVQTVQQPPKPRIIMSWGSLDGSICPIQLNTAPLTDFKDQYDIAIVCGITDPGADKFEDERITVSSPYTITLGNLEISTPISKSMSDARAKITQETLKNLPVKHGTTVTVQIPEWYEVVVLPKGVNISDIRKLSDVSRYGGKILSQIGF